MSRKGEKSFQRCEVKNIEYLPFAFLKGENGVARPANNLSNKGKGLVYAGELAVLQCPRSEDDDGRLTSDYSRIKSKQGSYEDLRKVAGALVCEGCRFSEMSGVQAMDERTQYVRAETDQMEALAALERARSEIDSMTSFDHKPRLYE